MKRSLLLVTAVAAIPITAALAQTAPAGLAPEQIVKARRAGMFLSGGTLAAMKSSADANGDLALLAPGANAIRGWAAAIPTLFPEGSNLPPTKALPAVWSDRAGFEVAAANLGAAAEQLAAAARSGDRAAFTQAWTATRGACGACHDGYKGD